MDTALADTDGAYLASLREHGHVAAVTRPDFYLFGAAATPPELHQLIGQLRDRLGACPAGAPASPSLMTASGQ